MTLPSTGAMTASMINLEMKRSASAAFNMNDPEVRRLAGKPSGLISMSDFYGKTYEIIAVTVANANNKSVRDYFTNDEWLSAAPKRLVILHTIGSTNPAVPALVSGTARGGLLTIENQGQILGAGGLANSGVGGDAIRLDQSGVTIINSYRIWSGGGGGARGGNGGPGYYQTPYTYTEGEYGGPSYPNYFMALEGSSRTYFWAGANLGSNFASPLSYGGWLYYPGSFWYSQPGGENSEARSYYYIYRQQTRYNTYYTTGGTGGAGGRGMGSDAANSNGAAGSAGGTNAGNGGVGGNGGGWGLPGASGGTGNSGNNGAGSASTAGGLAGHYINGIANGTLTNIGSGTALGRVA